MRFKMSCLGMGEVLWGNNVLLRCKCMRVLEYMIILCLVILFSPTSRMVLRLYRERRMEMLKTNEEAQSNDLKQVSPRKTRAN